MLKVSGEVVARCLQRAAHCAERAQQARHPEDRQFYLDMERRWMSLARSYEFTDKLTTLTNELERRRGYPETGPRAAEPEPVDEDVMEKVMRECPL